MFQLILLAAVTRPPLTSEFTRYPAAAPLVGTPAKPRLDSPNTRMFRTALRRAAAEGPNFNGHFRLTHWGQGTNVIEWAVINLQTGRVWVAPEAAGSCWAPAESDGATVPEWYEVHIDSSLFYLHGCTSASPAPRTFDTRYVYVWEGSAPRLIRVEPLPK